MIIIVKPVQVIVGSYCNVEIVVQYRFLLDLRCVEIRSDCKNNIIGQKEKNVTYTKLDAHKFSTSKT